MTTELKQAAQDASEAIDWLLKNIRLDAPQLAGKAMGNAEKCASTLRAAIQQAEAQQPATTEPVGFTYQAEIDYANSTGGNGSFWRVPTDLGDEAVPLYTHPAPSVPDDVVRDAERYRWLADCNNYEAGLALIIDPKLTAHTLGEKIDAAMLAAK